MDTPQRLVERHCQQSEPFALATDDAGARRTLPGPMTGVEAVNCNDGRFTIRGRGDDFRERGDSLPLRESDPRVRDFRTILPNLEDVFLKLTGHSIRD